jgi:peptide/nickel transport system permease protein
MRWDVDGDGIADHSFLLPLDVDGDGIPEPPGDRVGVLRGDFGLSFVKKRPVIEVLAERLPATLELSVTSLILGLAVGLVIGILAAINHRKLFDNFSRVLAVTFDSVPIFWLSLMMLLFFASYLSVLPMGDRCKLTLESSCPPIWERWQYMVLPVFILSTGLIAGYSRYMRASMLDVMGQDYIRTARAKGMRARGIWFIHAARNALIPIATFLGPAITGLLGGALIVESIFNYPGVGRTAYEAAIARDYPMVMAVTIYAAIATILGYLLSDILYGLIDPRISFE